MEILGIVKSYEQGLDFFIPNQSTLAPPKFPQLESIQKETGTNCHAISARNQFNQGLEWGREKATKGQTKM
jgi:hypothetical protein